MRPIIIYSFGSWICYLRNVSIAIFRAIRYLVAQFSCCKTLLFTGEIAWNINEEYTSLLEQLNLNFVKCESGTLKKLKK